MNRTMNMRRFLFVIISVFLLTVLYSFLMNTIHKRVHHVEVDKATFDISTGMDYQLPTKSLEGIEPVDFVSLQEKSYMFIRYFDKSELQEGKSTIDDIPDTWYLVIEKPYAEYMQVTLNRHVIGTYGSPTGRSNIWDSIYFLPFRESELYNYDNRLTIELFSPSRTGIQGNIYMITDENGYLYYALNAVLEEVSQSTFYVTFIAALFLAIMILALRRQLNYRQAYIYYGLTCITLSLVMANFIEIPYTLVSYITFKKIIVIGYHASALFLFLSISHFLNAPRRINPPLWTLLLILVTNTMITNPIEYAKVMEWMNYLLIINSLFILFYLLYYRKRDLQKVIILSVGLFMTTISLIYLIGMNSVYSYAPESLQISFIILIFMGMGGYLVFIEFWEIGEEYAKQFERYKRQDRQAMDTTERDEEESLSVLTQIQEGFFYIDRNRFVIAPVNNVCFSIFGDDLLGKAVEELFFPDDEAESLFLQDTLDALFHQANGQVDGYIDLLPQEIKRNNRLFILRYQYDSKTKTLAVFVNDITQLRRLEHLIYKKEEEKRFIINSLKHRRDLSNLLMNFHRMLKQMETYEMDERGMRMIHTLKGNMGQFGFKSVEQELHQVESKFEASRGEDMAHRMKCADSCYKALNLALEKDLKVLHTALEEGELERYQDSFVVSNDQIDGIKEFFTQHYKEVPHAAEFLRRLDEIRFINLKDIIKDYDEYIIELATSMDKAVLPLVIEGNDYYVDPYKIDELIWHISAIFRNCIAHGIETVEQRVNKGKQSYGQITVSLLPAIGTSERLEIRITDDGHGINPEAVRKKAMDRELLSQEELDMMRDEQVLQLLFEDRMSLKGAVDLIAGRGVGLSSVREAVEHMEGFVYLLSVYGEYTTIIINIPIQQIT